MGTSSGLGLLLIRIPLGVFFAWAGVNKLTSEGGVGGFVDFAKGMVPDWAQGFDQYMDMYLQSIPYAEVALGALLVLGAFTRLSGLLIALMITSFSLASGAFTEQPHGIFHPNILMIAMAAGLMFTGAGPLSVDWRVLRSRGSAGSVSPPGRL